MVLQEVLQSVSYLTDANGRKTAVLLDLEVWEALIAQLDLPPITPSTTTMDDDLYQADMNGLLNLLKESAVATGIPDLAHEHDHYIHGTPKRGEQ